MKSFLLFFYTAICHVLCGASLSVVHPVPVPLPVVVAPVPVPVQHNWYFFNIPTKRFLVALQQYLLITSVAVQVSSKSMSASSTLESFPCPALVDENLIILSSTCVASVVFLLSFLHGPLMSRSQMLGASLSLGQLFFLMFWFFFGDASTSVETMIRNLAINSEVTFYLPMVAFMLFLVGRFS